MTTYNDLFFRTNFSDSGQLPSPPPAYTSPDIIPSGLTPNSDPAGFFTNNYGSDPGQALINNANNYVYLRTKDLAPKAQQGSVSLYYAPASLLLYPSQWANNALRTSDNADHVIVSASGQNAIAVANNPFIFNPPSLSPGDHFCLISRVVTEEHPNPIPPTGSVSSLTEFVINNPGFGWRNVSVTSVGSPTFNTPVKYSQGDESGPMLFVLTCSNVPDGAQVAFSAGTPGPSPLISIPKSTVQNSPDPQTGVPTFKVGILCEVPRGYETNITYSYWANGTQPQQGFDINLSVHHFVEQGHALYNRLLSPQRLGVPASLMSSLGARRGLVLGAHTTRGV
jgi:hypothetical protein